MNNRKKIYAVDFDNTLAITNYPTILEPIQPMIDYCIALKKQGHTLILWTCREGKELYDAVQWCAVRGLQFDYANRNTPEIIKSFGKDTRKIFANCYIDDRAFDLTEEIKWF